VAGSSPRRRNERGVVFPSPVVMLSIIAVAMAGIAYVATRGQEPAERQVTTVSTEQHVTPRAPKRKPEPTLSAHEPKKLQPVVKRGSVYVEVYNNSGITGLAGRVAGQASDAGWQVVGSDNWYGTIPGSTVYYPERLKAAARMLALDLGVHRVAPAVDPMRRDRLTVVLTADAA
jgi:LytR cell envelope-related transcriptional attenuator